MALSLIFPDVQFLLIVWMYLRDKTKMTSSDTSHTSASNVDEPNHTHTKSLRFGLSEVAGSDITFSKVEDSVAATAADSFSTLIIDNRAIGTDSHPHRATMMRMLQHLQSMLQTIADVAVKFQLQSPYCIHIALSSLSWIITITVYPYIYLPPLAISITLYFKAKINPNLV